MFTVKELADFPREISDKRQRDMDAILKTDAHVYER